jgi:predicted aldo/keto reductase-like oxidoreductase
MSPHYCRGCDDACTAACPDGIAIGAVLHFHMYDRGYDRPERARRHYQALAPERRFSDRCLDCNACSEACPHGVDAASRVRDARGRLG